MLPAPSVTLKLTQYAPTRSKLTGRDVRWVGLNWPLGSPGTQTGAVCHATPDQYSAVSTCLIYAYPGYARGVVQGIEGQVMGADSDRFSGFLDGTVGLKNAKCRKAAEVEGGHGIFDIVNCLDDVHPVPLAQAESRVVGADAVSGKVAGREGNLVRAFLGEVDRRNCPCVGDNVRKDPHRLHLPVRPIPIAGSPNMSNLDPQLVESRPVLDDQPGDVLDLSRRYSTWCEPCAAGRAAPDEY